MLLGLRPNAIEPVQQSEPETLAGHITLVEHVGADTILGVRLDGAVTAHDDEGAPSSDVMVTVPGYSLLALGDAVWLRATLADAVLFSPQTGARL